MKRSEFIENIRCIRRVCKGPLTKEAREVVNNYLTKYFTSGEEPYLIKARQLDAANRGRKDLISDIVYEIDNKGRKLTKMTTASGDVVTYITGSGCGYNFNLTIENGPWDGEIHSYKCPSCKAEGDYRAPHYVGEEKP
jgi:hypothetical protein